HLDIPVAAVHAERLASRDEIEFARRRILMHGDGVVVDDKVALTRNRVGISGDRELDLSAPLPRGWCEAGNPADRGGRSPGALLLCCYGDSTFSTGRADS